MNLGTMLRTHNGIAIVVLSLDFRKTIGSPTRTNLSSSSLYGDRVADLNKQLDLLVNI